MANDDHTARLMKGWAAWNAWREDNPDVRQPHLVKAFLAGADFRGGEPRWRGPSRDTGSKAIECD